MRTIATLFIVTIFITTGNCEEQQKLAFGLGVIPTLDKEEASVWFDLADKASRNEEEIASIRKKFQNCFPGFKRRSVHQHIVMDGKLIWKSYFRKIDVKLVSIREDDIYTYSFKVYGEVPGAAKLSLLSEKGKPSTCSLQFDRKGFEDAFRIIWKFLDIHVEPYNLKIQWNVDLDPDGPFARFTGTFVGIQTKPPLEVQE